MKKIMLVLARECRMRFRRPAFWVLTLLVPLLLAALYALPVIAANRSAEQAQLLVVDETGLFEHAFCFSTNLMSLLGSSTSAIRPSPRMLAPEMYSWLVKYRPRDLSTA